MVLVGKQSRCGIDAVVGISLTGRIGHDIRHRGAVVAVNGINIILDCLPADCTAEQVLPCIRYGVALALEQGLMSPHPVIELICVDMVPCRQFLDHCGSLGSRLTCGIIGNIAVSGEYRKIRGAVQRRRRAGAFINIRLCQIAGIILLRKRPLHRHLRCFSRADAHGRGQLRDGSFQMRDCKMQRSGPAAAAGIVKGDRKIRRFAGSVHRFVRCDPGDGRGLGSYCNRAACRAEQHYNT